MLSLTEADFELNSKSCHDGMLPHHSFFVAVKNATCAYQNMV